MDNKNEMAEILRRITTLRSEMVAEYPFFGRLLLHLTPAVAVCGTACTDMEKIIFDPTFVQKLSDDELKFVMLHEVMHCVLKHCIRGQTLDSSLFNIACDIVVNSLIFEAMGIKTFTVYGEEPMHLTPYAREGRDYTAEEVYDMLLNQSSGNKQHGGVPSNCNENSDGKGDDKTGVTGTSGSIDSHEIWSEIKESDSQRLSDVWETRIHAASKKCGSGTGVPCGIKRYLTETDHMPKTNWKQILADFIRHDRADYTFQCRDTRYNGDIIMPSFADNIFGDSVFDLWLCVDTSGSISTEILGIIYSEILSASAQLDNFSGKMAFFDTALSDFFLFESEEDIKKISPVGGGGTSFNCIFNRLAKCSEDELPVGIVILTDGYARFPDEEYALNIPVMWVIVNSDVEPEWGTVIYIEE